MSKIEVDAIDKQSGSTLTLGGSGTAVTLASGATQSGFGRTGTVDWDTTPKTATFTAVSGDGFFANTTGSAFNMNLPAGVAGAIVSVADYAGTWHLNNLTVVPNGSDKIGSLSANLVLNTEGQSVTFLFVDSTQGWLNIQDSTSNERAETFISATGGTISTDGNFKVHKFTGPGTFCVASIGSTAANNEVSYIVVAGGGAGQFNYGGGGGAGGYRERKSAVDSYTASPLNGATPITVTATGFPITVGAGGTTAPTSCKGGSGNPSTFSSVTSAGGGGGGVGANCSNYQGLNGGSGGGGGSPGPGCGGSNSCGGAGNTPPVSPSQGFPGSDGNRNPSTHTYGGGGGGATATGVNAAHPIPANPTGGNAGAGATTCITGSPVAYAGGGGGARNNTGPKTSGGVGGGGAGSNAAGPSPKDAGAGTVNTGGGGGAGTSSCGAAGAGGSGVVIIRYKYQ